MPVFSTTQKVKTGRLWFEASLGKISETTSQQKKEANCGGSFYNLSCTGSVGWKIVVQGWPWAKCKTLSKK
jgi:hypothetical protein